MKKIFFVVAAALGFINLSAQEKTTASQFGFKTSANMSAFNGKDAQHKDYSVGFGAGLYGHFVITDQFAIQPEVNYTRMVGSNREEIRGDLGNATYSTAKYKDKAILDYIQVPVMIKFYPGGSRFNIEAGPQVGFNIYASERSIVNVLGHSVDSSEAKADIKNNIKNFDFGFNFGLGYNLSDNVNIGARYYMGVTKITENVAGGTQTGPDVKNHSFSLGVGYSF